MITNLKQCWSCEQHKSYATMSQEHFLYDHPSTYHHARCWKIFQSEALWKDKCTHCHMAICQGHTIHNECAYNKKKLQEKTDKKERQQLLKEQAAFDKLQSLDNPYITQITTYLSHRLSILESWPELSNDDLDLEKYIALHYLKLMDKERDTWPSNEILNCTTLTQLNTLCCKIKS